MDKQDHDKGRFVVSHHGVAELHTLDASLNPYGRHLRHLAEHAGTIPARLDEFGRCAYCVQRGWWKPDV